MAISPAATLASNGLAALFNPGERQSFPRTEPDSEIEVLLEPTAGGTRITVRHSNVPDGHTSYRDGGWQRSYFEPMKEYFKRAP
jgi:Activator of Hsp90 ATPase homolog 1-like protein